MNSQNILDAMTNIENVYILSAQKKLGYDGNTRSDMIPVNPKKMIFRRTLALFAAVIAMMAVLFTAAFAASPEFREKVYTFFGITEPEVIPEMTPGEESNPGNMEVEENRVTIGGVIEGTYIHYPAFSHARNGIFMICTDEVMMNSGNHYDAYYEENGKFIGLEEYTFCQDYRILDNDIHVEFEWVEYNGNVSFTYVDGNVRFHKFNLAGDVSATLFTLDIDLPGELGNTSYPVLINVATGELTDICAGTGVEKLPGIYQAAISEDLTRLLLVDWDENLYYVDLIAKQLYHVDDLAGARVEECALVGDTLACWVLEGDSIGEATLGTYRVWSVDLTTMECRELFSGMPATAATSYDVWSNAYDVPPELWEERGSGAVREPLSCEGLHFIDGFSRTSHWGNMYSGSKFAVEVDSGRNVYIIDLATGERTIVDGFLWPDMEYPQIQCSPSADGEKLLIYTTTMEGYYGSIGVLDYRAKSYTEFSRENLSGMREHTIYWFDNNSIIIATSDREDSVDYYVYRLLDGK